MKRKIHAKVENNKHKFKIKGNQVSWKFKRGVIELDIDELDKVFYEYSKHGLNLSQTKVQNLHGFDAIQWQSFKRTFDLVKDSDVFSPYTLSLVSGKKACDMIASKIQEKYSPQNRRAIIEYEDIKQTKKAYDSAIKRVEDLDYRFQILETEILDHVVSVKEIKIKKSDDTNIEHGVSIVADIHGGANVKGSFNLPAYNWSVIKNKLDKVANDINSRKAKKNTIILAGDLIESFTGLNHINSWKELDEYGGYGIDAVIEIIKILSEWLQKINNLYEVVIISGNHDRVTSDNKEDVEGEVSKLISFVLKGQFGELVKWENLIARRKISGCGFLFMHGDKGLSKKKGDLIGQYGYSGLYNIAFLGHLHTRQVVTDNLTYRILQVPSIFTGNSYSKRGGWSTLSGYTFSYVEDKYPIVIDVPLS